MPCGGARESARVTGAPRKTRLPPALTDSNAYRAELRAEGEGGTADVVSEEGLGERRVCHVVIDAVVDVVALARCALQRPPPAASISCFAHAMHDAMHEMIDALHASEIDGVYFHPIGARAKEQVRQGKGRRTEGQATPADAVEMRRGRRGRGASGGREKKEDLLDCDSSARG